MSSPAPAILRLPEVLRRTGLSRSGVYERMTRGEFPVSVSLGLRAVGWHESDVSDWINSRVSNTQPIKSSEVAA